VEEDSCKLQSHKGIISMAYKRLCMSIRKPLEKWAKTLSRHVIKKISGHAWWLIPVILGLRR
jgi:uncharacterized membrane protein (Fun14 family)